MSARHSRVHSLPKSWSARHENWQLPALATPFSVSFSRSPSASKNSWICSCKKGRRTQEEYPQHPSTHHNLKPTVEERTLTLPPLPAQHGRCRPRLGRRRSPRRPASVGA
jgi:hypothetical protein